MIKKFLFLKIIVCGLLFSNFLLAATSAEPQKTVPTSSTKVAPTTTHTETTSPADDPLEPFNRSMFSFNEFIDRIFLKPVAKFYNDVIPKPIRMGVSNFYDNINMLPTIAYDVLQGQFHQGVNDVWRFAVNSTIGVYGLIDVASVINLKKNQQDFGLTLAKWGYKNSTYIVLPFWGPRTLRDVVGMPIDYFAFSIYPHIHPKRDRYIVYGIGVLDTRARLLQFQSVYETAALDKYTFVRDAYLQRRAYLIDANNNVH
jgi:phospholipid-binding lipoprotein MlaA